jgi:hypothetical protein
MKTAGACIALILAATAAPAQEVLRFALIADAPGRVWVLDAATGSLARCRHVEATAPKIVEVFGAEAAVRGAGDAGGVPECWKWGEMAGFAAPGTEGWVAGEPAVQESATAAPATSLAVARPKVLSVFGGEVYATSP